MQTRHEQLDGCCVRLRSLFRDVELKAKSQEFEVGLGDITGYGQHHSAPRLLGCEILCSSSLISAADATPEIYFPGCAGYTQEEPLSSRCVRGRTVDELIVTEARDRQIIQVRKVFRPRLRSYLARLFDARHSDGHVVVVGQS